ncbi:ABC-type nitrate/sulfonate/bicarbonate transport system, permease component [Methanolobus tindarius DSM 2278]|jgi:NitT/TauT family transport system permease protein|uniref:ABC-type nitrate/sulfonate/bicarbonate transport system, permease component n=1 Tax=Methanolobus tindarius DSM 2278 TaxID=1090322 RepID=W9DVY8_METTI|nr:ABC transporter permease subunit [Methanolobus tindarius]ETA67561.1 ABC-type nitrate/sulfonate/bicarbonate transport system, permease component [Methanolobus tindarius DSM 2278]
MVKKHIQALKEKSVEIISIFSTIVLWQIIAVYVVGNKFYLPSFTDVAGALVEIISRDSSLTIVGLDLQLPMLVVDFLYSMMHFSIGIIAALIIGIPIGMIMGWFRTIDRIVDPIIEIIRPIPPLAWIPFAIIWIGLNPFAAGFLIFVGAVFPIMINTFTGFKSVSRVYVEAAKVLGCNTNVELIRYVALPSALPSIAAGIRIAMGVGWMCLVAAEMFGVSSNGLGYQMWHFYDLHRMEFVLVYMLILGFLGLFIDRLLRYYIDGKLLKWRKGVVI